MHGLSRRPGAFPRALRRGSRASTSTRLEEATGKRLGDPRQPLLVSVRSGAAVSMPGMMETILNLGLNDETVEALARAERQRALCVGLLSALPADVRRRGARRPRGTLRAPPDDQANASRGSSRTPTCSEAALRALVDEYKALVRSVTGADFPMDPHGAAVGRDRSGLAFVDAQEGRRLSQGERHRRRPRAPASTSSRWCSATWATTPAPASRSRAIRRPASASSTASSW